MVNILNYAIKFYGLKENIASLTGNLKRKTKLKKNVDFWTYEEYSKYISVIDNNVYKALFETLYYTELRQGEALALTWKNFKNYYLYLNKWKQFYKKCIGFDEEYYTFGGLNLLAPTTSGRNKDIYYKKAHIKKIKIHNFRHSHASLLLSKK